MKKNLNTNERTEIKTRAEAKIGGRRRGNISDRTKLSKRVPDDSKRAKRSTNNLFFPIGKTRSCSFHRQFESNLRILPTRG